MYRDPQIVDAPFSDMSSSPPAKPAGVFSSSLQRCIGAPIA
jgi:hypothetical protein